MRCSGRLTIRPCCPNDSTECTFDVGVPVDAWWCDGWWEGVVTGVNISGTDTLQVYFPGEEKLMIFQRKDVRASRDWVENTWVDVKAKPDILLHISENISSSMKLLTISASSMAEEKQKLPDLSPPDDVFGNVKRVNLRKRPCTSNEDEKNNSSGGDGGDDGTCNKDELIYKEEVDPAYEKSETPGATEMASQG
ncbi:uncharacterized protein LOC110771650 [Prunus avium]|uniref:Uncharacterized protein LOC110771650 n=1 Tax=Prunus avium TaxID=42229 RepID=A0A6P5TWX8_PRUAV|nr:uncharacterized protein LOC110771650 [Prunus avium]